MEWISVNEEMPDDNGFYLCFGTYGVRCAHYDRFMRSFQDLESGNDEGMCDMHGREYQVSHWMPLPNPPLEDQ